MKQKIHYILVFIFIILTGNEVKSQCAGLTYLSEEGTFNVNEIKGCSPLDVQICINSTAACDCVSCICDIIFGDGTGDMFSHTYTEPGIYSLEIIYPNNSAIQSDRITIEVTDKSEPDFDIYACSGNKVRVDIQDNQYDNYHINFGDGTQTTVPINTADQEHTYTGNATRTITLQGADNNAVQNCPSSGQSFTPLVSLPSAIITELSVIDETISKLSYDLEPNILYQLEIQVNGLNNFNFLKQLNNSTSIDTIRSLDLINNFYCFRIGAVDPCTNVTTYSNSICSINLQLDVLDGSNQLNWETNNPTGNFSIARTVIDDNGSSTTNPYGPLFNNAARSYNDIDVGCNTEYCYRLEAEFGAGISISNTICGTAISTLTPDSISDVSISVTEQGIQLYWNESTTTVNNYEIRSNNLKIAETSDLEYLDSNSNGNSSPICYTFKSFDECDNTNESADLCSIYLSGSISSDNLVTLTWNEYQGYENGVSNYQIEKYYNLSLVGTSQSSTNLLEQTDTNDNEQILNYKVTALPTSSTLPPSESNIITLIKPNNIYYPTAFTPDGKGSSINETFAVQARYIAIYRMQIFNRWGEMVYTTESPEEGWDGNYNSKPQQEGTYIFNLEIIDLAGRQIKRNGSFLLLRR